MEAGDLQQPLLTCVQSAPHTLRHDVDIAHDDLFLIPDLPVFVTKASSLLLDLLLLLRTIKKKANTTTATTFIVFPKKTEEREQNRKELKINLSKLLLLLHSALENLKNSAIEMMRVRVVAPRLPISKSLKSTFLEVFPLLEIMYDV